MLVVKYAFPGIKLYALVLNTLMRDFVSFAFITIRAGVF